ncbi:helix-turn-helix transcriptional regulator [Sulfurimonas sp.]|uniref:helix-turn-helix domain-containing protein n=1 Tax=Sulfurimonas sp. TaxID=2022749 RepID=UPI0026127F22|nr:helix-turn-helix transcriptional regulator [Sulfurimonas sp.]
MLFGIYLKTCRENYNFTQEELVQKLYAFDDLFEGLDIGTLSRWERSTTKPNVDKQIQILKFFQTQSGLILSCFGEDEPQAIEEKLCKIGVKNLLGTSKEHILNAPTSFFNIKYASITHIHQAKDIDKALAMPYSTILSLTNNVYNLSLQTIKEWSLNPNNFFIYAQYHEEFAGMFFSLRLKPEVFHNLLNFKTEFNDIRADDFASFDEMGCDMPLAFFAHNDKISSLLIISNFAHLIANQKNIKEVGSITLLDGAKKLLQNINLKHYNTTTSKQGNLDSYMEKLSKVLVNESIVKMLFQKEKCPD